MLKYFGKSDIGRIRSDNEDYYTVKKIDKEETLFIVADGMGGHQAGDVASSLGTTSFVKQYKKLRAGEMSIPKSLKIALEKANNSILDKATKEPDKKGMGTTFSAFVVEGMKGYIIHIGDSRIYQVRNNKIKQLTIDHTFVEKMVQNGKITRKEARTHPHRNILYYSLGAREVLEPHVINEFEIYDNDSFLIC
jgi:protein phosphatase